MRRVSWSKAKPHSGNKAALLLGKMHTLIQFLQQTPLGWLALLFVLENVCIFVGVIIVGAWLASRYHHRPVAGAAEPLSRTEIMLALCTVGINTLVTFVGLLLWRQSIIQFRDEIGVAVLLDFLFLVIAMDIAMYVLHRFAHHPLFFKLVHRVHHRYDNPRPLTLFVMNPLEALSFGVLWLLLVSLYNATWLGMSVYLVFNVVFGLIGHVGVEPLTERWKTTPVIKYISTSSFHAGHHHDGNYNFGFYTLIWDRLFGTLEPDYEHKAAPQ